MLNITNPRGYRIIYIDVCIGKWPVTFKLYGDDGQELSNSSHFLSFTCQESSLLAEVIFRDPDKDKLYSETFILKDTRIIHL